MATMTIAPTGAEYTHHRYHQMFEGLTLANLQVNTATKLILTTPAGDRLVINGSNLVLVPGADDPWVSGTITSIEFRSRNLVTEYARITGLDVDLSAFGEAVSANANTVGALLFRGADIFVGGNGNDNLYGWDGHDSFYGGKGDDHFLVGSGSDTVDGGEGWNSITYWNYEAWREPTRTVGITVDLGSGYVTDPWGFKDYLINIQEVEGTALKDTFIGTERADGFVGFAGDDYFSGGGGDDTFMPDKGADTIHGGSGFDLVIYNNNTETTGVNVNLATGMARDPWGSTDTLVGVEWVRASANADTLVGSAADERFQGLAGADSIDGGEGSDTIDFSHDYRGGGFKGVVVNLTAGYATDGFGATDTLLSIENVIATQHNDLIIGNDTTNSIKGDAGDDELQGRGGNDILEGGDGNDILYGGLGSDSAVFVHGRASYSFSLGTTGAVLVSGDGFTDVIYDVEAFRFADGTYSLEQLLPVRPVDPTPTEPVDPGPIDPTPPEPKPTSYATSMSFVLPGWALDVTAQGKANISLTGNDLDNTIIGNVGKNTIAAGGGNDRVNGGSGNDTLTGGQGQDAFLFTTKLGTSNTDRKVNFDTIKDFSVSDDSLWLDNAVFKKLGSGTPIKPKQLNKGFFSLDKAKDKNDYLIYNKKTGVLSYDADGVSKGQAIEFAQLKKGLSLTYKDFFII